jgi:hypothetical protein
MRAPYRKRWRMTRKDEKDTERPHYYSQFWLDVAAGRREIGSSKTDESSDADDMPEPSASVRKGNRPAAAALVDGHRSTHARDFDEENFAADEPFGTDEADELDNYNEPEMEDELEGNLDDDDIPNILVENPSGEEDEDIDLPLAEEEESFDEDEYYDDEEEDEDDWSARGRKKPKPGRQTKAPKAPPTKPKRGGRGY